MLGLNELIIHHVKKKKKNIKPKEKRSGLFLIREVWLSGQSCFILDAR